MTVLHEVAGDLIAGEVVERPNRFVLNVSVENELARAHLADPGRLDVLEPGSTVLCRPVDDDDRTTAYDAIAVDANGTWVSLRASLANDLFVRAVERNLIDAFERYDVLEREPVLPTHGRADVRLQAASGDTVLVEVKSATHVEDRTAKFPDRQTERGRRQVSTLTEMAEAGHTVAVVFVIQQPDVDRLVPYRRVDPDFADLIETAMDAGVAVHALATVFDPPVYRLARASVPVELR